MCKTIFTGFGPNITDQDVRNAWSLSFTPWKWKKGNFVLEIENWLKEYFESKFSFTFDSGRTALHYSLKALGVGDGDEVLVQS